MNSVLSKIPLEIRGINFTYVERQILECLSDGEAHTLESMKEYDKLVELQTIKSHVHNMRKKMNVSRYRIYSGVESNLLIYRLVLVLPIARPMD